MARAAGDTWDIVTSVGFTALAFIKDPNNKTKLYWRLMDPNIYSPIEQGMVLLKRAKDDANAQKFYQYILSPAAKAIFEDYGYGEHP